MNVTRDRFVVQVPIFQFALLPATSQPSSHLDRIGNDEAVVVVVLGNDHIRLAGRDVSGVSLLVNFMDGSHNTIDHRRLVY